MDEKIFSQKLLVSDATSLFRKARKANDPPFTRAAIKRNNKTVDRWENELLKSLANQQGKVRALDVTSSFMVFYEGIFIREMFADEKFLFPQVSDEQKTYWVSFFEDRKMEELLLYPREYVLKGWHIINEYVDSWVLGQKWENVYKHSENPQEWFRLYKKHKDIFNNKVLPFWDNKIFVEIFEKISAISKETIQPKGFM